MGLGYVDGIDEVAGAGGWASGAHAAGAAARTSRCSGWRGTAGASLGTGVRCAGPASVEFGPRVGSEHAANAEQHLGVCLFQVGARVRNLEKADAKMLLGIRG